MWTAFPFSTPARTGGGHFLSNWQLVREQLSANAIEHFAVPDGHRFKFGVAATSFNALRRVLRSLALRPGVSVEYQFHEAWHRYVPFITPTRLLGRPARFRIYQRTNIPGLDRNPTAHACLVELWAETDKSLETRHGNARAARVARNQPRVPCPLDPPTQCYSSHLGPPSALLADFPIDVVYTWVDGSDAQWRTDRSKCRAEIGDLSRAHPSVDSESRYADRGELRYSLRSLCLFADFFRYVYIVTADQTPPWLDTEHPRLRMVSHRDIFTNPTDLPTFNSHAIESQLHHIDGLAEHFLYLNDDVFFLRPQVPENYFSPNGLALPSFSRNNIPPVLDGRAERPIDHANQTTQAVILTNFHRLATHKPQHAPHPLLRSLLYDIEREYAELIESTARSRFRTTKDVSLASSLFSYYALMVKHAALGSTKSRYIDINDWLFPLLARPRTLAVRYDTLCLNEVDLGRVPPLLRDKLVTRILDRLYPVASPFEKPYDTK